MATEQQVPKLVASLVEHQSAFAILSVDDAQWAITNTKDAIALACTAIQNRVKTIVKKVITLVQLPLVTSDGISGKDDIRDLERSGYRVGDWAKDVMGKPAYVVTNGRVYKPVIIKGEEFTDDERVTSNIRKVAEEMGLITPPAELARLLRKSVSDQEIAAMGLWALIVMHEPITGSSGHPRLLGVDRDGDGRWVHTFNGRSDDGWRRERGFVFLAPQG